MTTTLTPVEKIEGSNLPPARNDHFYLAATLWAEARGEGRIGMRLVGHVIMNRVKDRRGRFGDGVQGVVLKPWQFSCWNKGDPNLKLLNRDYLDSKLHYKSLDYIRWQEAQALATELLAGDLPDLTKGGDHYHTDRVNPVWNRTTDKKGVTLLERVSQVGNHIFYRTR